MKSRLTMIKPLVFACSIALTACGGSDDGSVTTPITVSGIAEAPSGIVAQFEENKPFLVAAIEFVFPGAVAGITGLQPVTTATVQLIRIDDDGNQMGAVLAETFTSTTGNYSLALPSGVSLAGDLVVRITGNSGASMSAMVVDQAVNINPISEFVLSKFVDDDTLVLADLAINEVVALSGKVDDFDLTATADLATMIDQLEAQVGDFVDNEIVIIEATPDDGAAAAAVAGGWRTVEFSMGMHDSDPATTGIQFGTFALDLSSEEMTIADGGNGVLNFTIGQSMVDTFTNYSVDNLGNTSIFHEIGLGEASDTFAATIDAVSNINISFPFEEELQTVDVIGGINDPQNDGPDFGWRYPPGNISLSPVANDNTYVSILTDASVRYETTDTNNDGINDAVDPNARSGDEVSLSLLLILKEGSGMTNASLNGNFGLVALNVNLDSTVPEGVFDSTVGVISFNDGTATKAVNAFDVQEIIRAPSTPPAVTLTASSRTEPGTLQTIPYTVSASGQVTLDPGVDALEGYTNSDGTVIAIVDDVSLGDPVSNINNEMLMAVKLGTHMQTSLNGATYKLYPLVAGMGANGYTEISTLTGTVVFNADASYATVEGSDRGVSRGTDVAEIEAIIPDATASADIFTVISVSGKGEVTMSSTNGTFTDTLTGFVSADSNLLVLRVYGNDTTGDQDLGLVVGVKQ